MHPQTQRDTTARLIGTTDHGFRVFALTGFDSPMKNHRGGEIAVDEENRAMYAWGIFVAAYGTDSIMRACNRFPDRSC